MTHMIPHHRLLSCLDSENKINCWVIKMLVLEGNKPIYGFMIKQIQKVKLPIKLAPDIFPWNVCIVNSKEASTGNKLWAQNNKANFIWRFVIFFMLLFLKNNIF